VTAVTRKVVWAATLPGIAMPARAAFRAAF